SRTPLSSTSWPKARPSILAGIWVLAIPLALRAVTKSRARLLADGSVLGGGTGQVGNVRRAGEIDLEQLFYSRGAAVAETFTVALVDHELMVVDRDGVADPR